MFTKLGRNRAERQDTVTKNRLQHSIHQNNYNQEYARERLVESLANLEQRARELREQLLEKNSKGELRSVVSVSISGLVDDANKVRQAHDDCLREAEMARVLAWISKES